MAEDPLKSNEAHKWAHRTRAENGWLISFLQDWKPIQGRAHHGRHHGGTRNTTFCAITVWVDPLLDRVGIWRGLERVIAACTGVLLRVDPAVAARRAHGRAA